jgi:hypothetical protein
VLTTHRSLVADKPPVRTSNFFARLFTSTKTRAKSRDEHTSAISKSHTIESSLCNSGDTHAATPTELSTFSAQFPPLEWLPDPRWLHSVPTTTGSSGAQFWLQPHVFSSTEHGSRKESSRDAHDALAAVSSRRNTAQHTAINARFSKYLSSSSEALQYLGPVDPPELLPGVCVRVRRSFYFCSFRRL